MFKEKIDYTHLNARQKEIYNFQKVSGIFADFGYTTVKLSDDWMGADFIAISFDGFKYIKVQLKGRLTFEKKYIGKDIYVCFHDKKNDKWYLYQHDDMLKHFIKGFECTRSWRDVGGYSKGHLSRDAKKALEGYLLA